MNLHVTDFQVISKQWHLSQCSKRYMRWSSLLSCLHWKRILTNQHRANTILKKKHYLEIESTATKDCHIPIDYHISKCWPTSIEPAFIIASVTMLLGPSNTIDKIENTSHLQFLNSLPHLLLQTAISCVGIDYFPDLGDVTISWPMAARTVTCNKTIQSHCNNSNPNVLLKRAAIQSHTHKQIPRVDDCEIKASWQRHY